MPSAMARHFRELRFYILFTETWQEIWRKSLCWLESQQMSAAPHLHTQAEPNPADPLHVSTPLLQSKCFYPFGFPVRISSNSRIVLESAELSWSHHTKRFDTDELEVRCFVSESESAACSTPAVFRSQEHLVTIVADYENFAAVDLNERLSFGWVTNATAANTNYFRYMFLDAMAYLQLEIHHVITIHAACVQFAQRGLLLAGHSGAGKSSLAYACARNGWTFLSDDGTAFVRRSKSLEALGTPEQFRFRHTASDLFPEFQDLMTSQRPAGKPTIEVPSSTLDGIRTAQSCAVHALIFLNRDAFDGDRPSMVALTKTEAWHRLTSSLFALQHPAYEERVRALRRLLDLPVFELRYREFGPALELLESFALGNPA